MSDDALVQVTIGHTDYAVYPNPNESEYDIFKGNGRIYFGSFQNPKYLDKKSLEEYIREHMRIRTGI